MSAAGAATLGGSPRAPRDSSVEQALASWVAALSWDAVPGPVQARVEDCFLDALASAFAGRTQDLLARVEVPAHAFGGPGEATVIGGRPASQPAAVFLNAYAITSATICDVYRPGLCHVTPVAVPPLLALAEVGEASLRDVLAALAVGLEVTVRVIRGLDYEQLRGRGWHSPGVVGPVGAAAAAARLLRLDASGVESALAHAAAQGAGTFAALGTEAVKFNQARAAVSGLLAARMGEAGLRAAPRWLTHTDGGMAHSYANGGDPEAVLEGLGSRWELEQVSLRRWPAASSVQSLIDSCLELCAEGLAADDVDRVAVELGPGAFEVSGPRGWDDPLSAQQSARWVVAATLEDRDWWLEQSGRDRIGVARTSAFAEERVCVSSASDLGSAAVRMRVALRSGEELVRERSDAPGDPTRPLTRAQIEEKLRRAAGAIGKLDVAGELVAQLETGRERRAGELIHALGEQS